LQAGNMPSSRGDLSKVISIRRWTTLYDCRTLKLEC
jgi:hypothetical protein